MILFKLLSEEIFDFSKETINSKKAKQLKETMIREFSEVFQLCMMVMQNYFQNKNAVKISLMKATIQTLTAFMSWIPIAYIYQTNMYKFLIESLSILQLRVDTLKCISEIAAIKLDDAEKVNHMKLFFMMSVKVEAILEKKAIDTEYANAKTNNVKQGIEAFSMQLLNTYNCFIINDIELIDKGIRDSSCSPEERVNVIEQVKDALNRMVQISNLPVEEIFKASMEFWGSFVKFVFQINSQRYLGPSSEILNTATFENSVYPQIFSKTKSIIMSKMARPSEVLVTVDEYGNVEQKQVEDSEMNSLYDIMKTTLRILAILDTQDTLMHIFELLESCLKEVINSGKLEPMACFCFSIGSIHDCLSTEDESTFLVAVIKDLLNVVDKLVGKGNKAAIAANIMYVVGSYPSFLRQHWKFNKTVIRKLIEFMHEPFAGVKDMACDTMIKIAKKCADCFTKIQEGENTIYIETLILGFASDSFDLNLQQKINYYECLSIIIASHLYTEQKQALIHKLLHPAYGQWNTIIADCTQNPNLVYEIKTIKDFDYFLRINQVICKSVGGAYACFMKLIYKELLDIYKCYSNAISIGVQKLGEKSLYDPVLKCMRLLRHNILRLLSIFFSTIETKQVLMNDFIPQMLQLLNEYATNDPNAKDAEILLLFASLFDILKDDLKPFITEIMTKLASPTLQMITVNFDLFPDHRRNYFDLLKSIVESCFSGLLAMDIAGVKVVLDSLIWGIKHQDPNISELNLSTILKFLTNCTENETLINGILGNFFMPICQDIFFILTDALHKSGFKLQTQILQFLIKSVATNSLRVPICIEAKNSSNKEYLGRFLIKALSITFTNVASSDISSFITGMFESCNDYNTFKENVRNFLIDIKEFGILEQPRENTVNINANSEEVKKVQAMMGQKHQAQQ